MFISSIMWRQARNLRWAVSLVSLALVFNSGIVSADWLSTLKDSLGKKDQAISADEAGSGLKEALRVGTDTVVGNLGQPGGFDLDPQIHIPLPKQLDKARSLLGKFGMDSMLTDLETKLNEAAEIATPKAKQLFMDAINDMTLDDVMAIYKGPDDAATQYFRSKMSAPLALEMKPVVDSSLEDVGALQLYDNVMQQYEEVPFAPKVDLDMSDYVVDKGMDGIFYYLAKEEAAIRNDPAKRTTELLKSVFGR
ncbi:MAG: DUF4197 domain-containing protein [Xanthomonadales bacterium]|nr:DUF4197 domain-containing protein [Xanthomonadales bacterium]